MIRMPRLLFWGVQLLPALGLYFVVMVSYLIIDPSLGRQEVELVLGKARAFEVDEKGEFLLFAEWNLSSADSRTELLSSLNVSVSGAQVEAPSVTVDTSYAHVSSAKTDAISLYLVEFVVVGKYEMAISSMADPQNVPARFILRQRAYGDSFLLISYLAAVGSAIVFVVRLRRVCSRRSFNLN